METSPRDRRLDFLPHRGNLCGQEANVPHLSPTTLTTDEQRLILRATTGNVRDHTIISLALGTGLRLAEIVGRDVGGGRRLLRFAEVASRLVAPRRLLRDAGARRRRPLRAPASPAVRAFLRCGPRYDEVVPVSRRGRDRRRRRAARAADDALVGREAAKRTLVHGVVGIACRTGS